MIVAIAGDTLLNAGLAQVEVAFLADAAVIVLIRYGLAAAVAVDAEGAREVTEAWEGGLAEVLGARSRTWWRIHVRVTGAECTGHSDSRLRGSSGLVGSLEAGLGLVGRSRLGQDGLEVGGPGLRFDIDQLHLLGLIVGLVIGEVYDRGSWLVGGHSGSLEAELQLGFGGTVELLVHRRVGAIKGNVGASRVGVSLEEKVDTLGNGKKDSQLFQGLAFVTVESTSGLSG